MSSRRREHASATAPHDAYTRTAHWPQEKYHTDHETERKRHRSSTVPVHAQDPRHYLVQGYYDAKQSSRAHRQDPQYPSATPSATHHQSAPGPSTTRTHRDHVARPPAQYTTSAPHPYHPGHSYQTAAALAPHGATPAPIPTSSRRAYPEAPDPRAYPQRVPTAAQTAHASYDKASVTAEAARSSRHRPAHPSTQPTSSAQPTHPSWVPPAQEMPSSRRHKENDRDREREQGRTKATECTPAELEKERYLEKERAERYKERSRATEAERHREPKDSSRTRHRMESDSEGIANVDRPRRHRADDGTVHRRHQSEEPPAHTHSTRRHAEATHNPISAAQPHSMNGPQADGVTHNQQGEQQSGNPPPAPRVMPVYLPPKAVKSHRSHHGRRLSVINQPGAQSGSDSEKQAGKHRMERTHSAAPQRPDGYVSNSTRDRGGRDAPAGPREESKYESQNTRQPLTQVNTGIPPVTSSHNAQSFPLDTRAGSSAPQFVSIRAGQGPTDPYDASFKLLASRSDNPQGMAPNYPHPTSASIIKPPPPSRTNSYEVSRSHAEQPAVGRTRAEPHGMEPGGPHVSAREASQPVPPSRTASQQAPETRVENTSSAYPSHPSRPPSYRIPSSNAIPTVSGPRPHRTSQALQPADLPTRPPSTTPYAPAIAPSQSHQSVPPSPANHSNSSSANARHVVGSSSAHPSPKDVQPAVSASYPDTHYRPAQIQRAPSGPPTAHATPLLAPQITRSSSQHSRHPRYSSAGDDQLQDNRFDVRQPLSQNTNHAGVRSSYTTQSTPASAKNISIMREDKYLRDQQPAPGLQDGVHHTQLRQVLSQDDPYPQLGSMMMRANQASTPPSASHRTPPPLATKDVRLSVSRSTSAGNSPQAWHKQTPTPEHARRNDLQPHQASSGLMGPPHIAIVGATPDSQAGALPQHLDHAMLAPPDAAPKRESRNKSGRKSSRATRNDSPPSQQALPIRQMPSQSQTQGPTPLMYMPSSSSPLATEVDNGESSPPPLPIPPPRGLEDSPSHGLETRMEEIMPAGTHGDEGDEETWDSNPVSFPPPSSMLPASRPHWQSGEVGDNAAVPQIWVTSLEMDARVSKPPAVPSVQPTGATDRAALISNQGTTREIYGHPPVSSAAKGRNKASVEDDPESPWMTSAQAAATSAPSSSRPATASQQPTTGYPYASASLKPADHVTARPSPPSRAKDSPSHRIVESTSVPPSTSTMPPAAPTAYTSTSRAPLSAPPIQQSFSTQSLHQPAQRSVSHSIAPRVTQRPAEPVQTTVKPSTGYSGSSVTHPSTTVQPTVVPQLNGPVPSATMAPRSTSTSAYTGAQTHAPTRPPALTSASTYAAASAHAVRPTVATANNIQQSVPAQQNTTGPVPSMMTATQNAPPQSTTSAQPPSATRPTGTTSASTYAASSAAHATKAAVAPVNAPQTTSSVPFSGALGLYGAASANGIGAQPTSTAETHRHQSGRYGALQQSSSQQPSATPPVPSSSKTQTTENPLVDSTRPRDTTSAPRNISSSNGYPSTSRPSAPTSTPFQPIHQRAVSVPTTQPPATSQDPPSPRKFSQPIPASGISTQPFPSKSSPPQPARIPVSGHLSTPAPPRAHLTPPDQSMSHDSEMLNTPSSLAQSPMPPSAPVPVRQRQVSTDSKDSAKKKFLNFFKTKSGSKENSAPAPPTRTSVDQQRPSVDAPTTSTSQRPAKEHKERSHVQQPPAATSSAHPNKGVSSSQSRSKTKFPNPVSVPPMQHSARERERKPSLTNVIPSLKFLNVTSSRKRTMSGLSLDVCDGNTATNTVVESPAQSTVSPAPFALIAPLPERDPILAAGEWRDKEAERREKKPGKIRRPGVTWDLGEDPPDPPAGSSTKKLLRRKSGRIGTPRLRDR